MEKKKCFKCGYEKELSLFYKHPAMKDGHLNKCIECTKKDSIRHRLDNLEKYREYDKKRASLEHRVAARNEYANAHKDKISGYKKAYRERNPLKTRAHGMVSYYLKKGYISKKPCGKCGCKKTEAHHDDYSKPLDVVWLCDKCHKERHKSLRSSNVPF